MTDAAVLGTRGTAWNPETRLYADGVVAGGNGEPLVVPPHSGLRRVAGTAFLDPASGDLPGAAGATTTDIDTARARLDATTIPGLDTPYAGMLRTALIDIEALTFPNGAAVAAASPYWRYVWPRDAGFMAVALCLAGRHAEARRLISYVARMQEADGGWQARYLPDGSGEVPDGRGRQLDGIGWTLWATWVWSRSSGADPGELISMVEAATTAAVEALDPSTGLPRASQDYWEMDIEEATLGTAAPLLLGLRCGRDLLFDAGRGELARRAETDAVRLGAAVHAGFGAHGYQRRLSGTGGLDASVAFLLPPFAPGGADVLEAWHTALAATSVDNGGVRPGEEWADLTTAWTPQVSLHALCAAAVGDTVTAHRLLSWLDVRRTSLGALPEKVTAAGAPAAVAPLGLTGATVIMAAACLDGSALPVPADTSNGGRA